MGKHVRPSKTVVATGTATAGLVLAGAAVGVTPAYAAPAAPLVPPATANLEALVEVPAPPPVVQHYHVKSGDTLTGIAARFCGSAAKWKQLWQANKGRIRNPNMIYPGELVRLVCAVLVPVVAPSTPPDPTVTSDPTAGGGPTAVPTPTVTVTGAQGVIGAGALRALKNLIYERIDEGQDFSGTGTLYPVAPGTIVNTANNGWPGSSYILEKLDAPADGYRYVYYAEDITPDAGVGRHVDGTTAIGTVYHGGTGIEVGWGTAIPGVAAAYGHYTDGVPTAEGQDFAHWLQANKHDPAASDPPPPPKPAPPSYPALAHHLSALGYDGSSMAVIASYLIAHGYSAAGAAGVIGCIAGESGGNPESVGMGGGGLIGWTPLPFGLVTGDKARDLEAQLARLIAYDNANGHVHELNAQPTANAAAWYYSAQFERPAVIGSDIRHEVVDAVFAALAG